MESVLDLYREVRKRFPEATAKADAEHRRLRFDIDSEFAFIWFENLAKALNREMMADVPAHVYEPLIFFLARAFSSSNIEIKECIDVSFIENLFWEVPTEKVPSYWNAMPPTLKELYVAFHGAGPY